MSYQSDFWNRYFTYYDVLMEVKPYRDLLTTIVDRLDIQPGDRVLDLGAGTGNLQYFLPAGTQSTSIDNSPAALARLRSKFPQAHTIQASILDPLPFADNSFDKVACNNVLYTLPRDAYHRIISEIRRVCKPDGIVVVSNLTANFSPMAIYRQNLKDTYQSLGGWATAQKMAGLIYPTLQMFRYNRKISKDDKAGTYTFVRGDEQREAFMRAGFDVRGASLQVYAGQASLDVFANAHVPQKACLVDT